jgi:predicted kinase
MTEFYYIGGEIYRVNSPEEGIAILISDPFVQLTPEQYLKKFPSIWKKSTGKEVPQYARKSLAGLWKFLVSKKMVQKATPSDRKKHGVNGVSMKNSPISGVYDPNIFKVIFLAGGPGSGKSAIAKALFGLKGTFSYTGLKSVNSDRFFEYLLSKEGIPSDFRNMSKADFEKITEGEGSIRSRAKNLNKAQFKSWLDGRLGVIIDGTGDNPKKIISQAKFLKKEFGYEPYMVFVNTNLSKAIDRNNKRARKLPENLVREIWSGAQEGLKRYKAFFKKDFVEIDNSKDVKKIELDKRITKSVDAFLRQPLTNAKAKAWIKSELNKKKRK